MSIESLLPLTLGRYIRPGFAPHDPIGRTTHGPTGVRRRTHAGQAFIRTEKAWLAAQGRPGAVSSASKARHRQRIATKLAEHRRGVRALSRHTTRP